jgi:signal transduction histidine kinase
MERSSVHEVYDDRVATLLHWGASAASAARLAALCNLIDLLIQDRKATHGAVRGFIFETLDLARADLTEGVLCSLAQSLRRAPNLQADLLDWFLSHGPGVRALVLENVRLLPETWFKLLPKLSRQERALVYARSDLGFEIKQFTASFGAPHLLLGGPLEPEPLLSTIVQEGPEQIGPQEVGPEENGPRELGFTQPQQMSPVLARNIPPDVQASQAQEQVRDLLERITAFQKKAMPTTIVAAQISPALEQQDAPALQHGDTAPVDREVQSNHEVGKSKERVNPLADIALDVGRSVADQTLAAHHHPYTQMHGLTCDLLWESDRYAILYSVVRTNDQLNNDAVYAWRHRSLLELCAKPRPPIALVRALERRVPFRDISVTITTQGVAARWQISGIPVFAKGTGLYLGFRGTASLCPLQEDQPKADYFSTPHQDLPPVKSAGLTSIKNQSPGAVETTAPSQSNASSPAPQQPSADSTANAIAALAHEFRTPLNAIMGFAQMIGGQTRGPVEPAYREHAEAILDQSHHVLQAIDDVTDVGKLERKIYPLLPSLLDPGLLIDQVLAAHKANALRHHIVLKRRIAQGLPGVWADLEAARKALSRLLGAVLGAAQHGEIITLGAHIAPKDQLCLSITRPLRLRSAEFAQFFTMHTPKDQPLAAIGIGFALRLAEHLAQAMGGRLVVTQISFDLSLPCLPNMLAPAALPEKQMEKQMSRVG